MVLTVLLALVTERKPQASGFTIQAQPR
jgi:hypothetical protein